MGHEHTTKSLEHTPLSLRERLLTPPTCSTPLIVAQKALIEPEYRRKKSSNVYKGFNQQLEMLSTFDSLVPFEERARSFPASYEWYRQLPEPQPGYWDMIDNFSQQAGPIDTGRKTTVAICVALAQEKDNIYRSLDNYASQTLSPNDFEILLFLNTKGKSPDTQEQSLSEIDRFRQDHPEIALQTFEHQLHDDDSVAYIKKIAHDVAMTRLANAPIETQTDHLLTMNDIDCMYLNPKYLQRYTEAFKERDEIDIGIQTFDLDHEAYRILGPDFLFQKRIGKFMNSIYYTNTDYVYGFDIAIRPEVYCASGGNVYQEGYGEDTFLAKTVQLYRNGGHTIEHLSPNEIGMQTSARRDIMKFFHGSSAASIMGSEKANRDIRAGRYTDSIPAAYAIPDQRHLVDSLQNYFATHPQPKDLPPGHPAYLAAAKYFGVAVAYQDEKYVITNGAKPFLQAYQQAFGK